VRDEACGGAVRVENPEGTGRGRRELGKQRERKLRPDQRGKLRKLLARKGATEDGESCRSRRHPELVGCGRHRSPCLTRLEPVLDRDRYDRIAEKVERGTLTPAVR
jgi:hypothetical protein